MTYEDEGRKQSRQGAQQMQRPGGGDELAYWKYRKTSMAREKEASGKRGGDEVRSIGRALGDL